MLALARDLRLASSAAERRAGVGAAGLRALRQLGDEPAASLTELARRTHTDVSSVSVVVKRLADHGLVDRRQTMGDRRRFSLGVTARGRAVLRREAPHAGSTRLTRAARRLTGGEVRALAVALAGLAAALRRAGVSGKTSSDLACRPTR